MIYNKSKDVLKQELKKTYVLTAAVTGKRNSETEWGETTQEDAVIIANLPCRISVQSLQGNNQTESTNNIDYNLKLFYAPEHKLNQGDKITITSAADAAYSQWVGRSFLVGTPMLYPSHMEVLIQDWRYA